MFHPTSWWGPQGSDAIPYVARQPQPIAPFAASQAVATENVQSVSATFPPPSMVWAPDGTQNMWPWAPDGTQNMWPWAPDGTQNMWPWALDGTQNMWPFYSAHRQYPGNTDQCPPLTCETTGMGVRNFVPGSKDPPVLMVNGPAFTDDHCQLPLPDWFQSAAFPFPPTAAAPFKSALVNPAKSTLVTSPKQPRQATLVTSPKQPRQAAWVTSPKQPRQAASVTSPKQPWQATSVTSPEQPRQATSVQAPGHVEKAPGRVEKVPDSAEKVPGKPPRYPDDPYFVEKAPGGVEMVPGCVEKAPGRVEKDPGCMEKDPGRVEKVPDGVEKVLGKPAQREISGIQMNAYASQWEPGWRSTEVCAEEWNELFQKRFDYRPYHEWRHEELERRRVYHEQRRLERDYDPAVTPDSAIDLASVDAADYGYEYASDGSVDEAIDPTYDRAAAAAATADSKCNCGRKLADHNVDDEAMPRPEPPIDWSNVRESESMDALWQRCEDGFDVVEKSHNSKHGHWIGGHLCNILGCTEPPKWSP